MSHDIKTRLVPSWDMEIWDSEKPNTKEKATTTAHNSGKHILSMLNNLLEFSRLNKILNNANHAV